MFQELAEQIVSTNGNMLLLMISLQEVQLPAETTLNLWMTKDVRCFHDLIRKHLKLKNAIGFYALHS